ncbi:MAG: hypothetical protein ABSD88_09360 [Candidatus Korobacteraceae bacterium]|jgi:guanyl-specific ribonuclease Sa
MKDLRILALASMLTLGLALLSAQAQAQMTDESSSTTTTTQQTVTTPAGQTTTTTQEIVTRPMTEQGTPENTVAPSAAEQGLPAGTDNLGVDDGGPIDYSQSPFWSPRDWNYIQSENGGG